MKVTVKLVDDYGHHPKEVEATIKAARAEPSRSSFGDVISATPLLVVPAIVLMTLCRSACLRSINYYYWKFILPVRKPIVGADSRTLARSIRLRGDR